MENKFKVGDLVIGNNGANNYNRTVKGWKGKVVRIINSEKIEVQNITSTVRYDVLSERFDLLEAAQPTEPSYQIY